MQSALKYKCASGGKLYSGIFTLCTAHRRLGQSKSCCQTQIQYSAPSQPVTWLDTEMHTTTTAIQSHMWTFAVSLPWPKMASHKKLMYSWSLMYLSSDRTIPQQLRSSSVTWLITWLQRQTYGKFSQIRHQICPATSWQASAVLNA